MIDGQELVEAPTTEMQRFREFDQELADFKEMNSKMVFDIETYEGETDCKKYLARVNKLRIGVEKLRKSLKQKSLEEGRSIDTDAKAYQAEIAMIDAVHSVPLKELENKRIAEALEVREAEQAKLQAIEDEHIADLEAREAKVAAKEAEQKVKDDKARAAREAAERKEELEVAALLAAEKAMLQAKQDAINTAAQAKQDTANAVAAEKKRVADLYEKEQAEQRQIDAGILARQQDVEHRKKINNLAVDALDALVTQSTELSIAIITEIAKGNIPGVRMVY